MRTSKDTSRLQRFFMYGILVCLFTLAGCGSSNILLSPLPDNIKSMEGYASIKISSKDRTARSKFTFLFRLPDQGWIEVCNFLGTTLYQIVIDGEEAYFVIPSKKAYWHGPEEEIIDVFLGFQLSLNDIISLLFGLWDRPVVTTGIRPTDAGWRLDKDGKGRIAAGRREKFSFRVEKFIENTAFALVLNYKHPYSQGQIRVLRMNVNSPIRPALFNKAFLKRFQQKTWFEIQEMLNDDR